MHKPWFPELDAVHFLYVAFEMLQEFENKPQIELTWWPLLTTKSLSVPAV